MFVGSAFTVGRQDFSIRSMDPHWQGALERDVQPPGHRRRPSHCQHRWASAPADWHLRRSLSGCCRLAKQHGPCCWPSR